jgi:hypothetical protein
MPCKKNISLEREKEAPARTALSRDKAGKKITTSD